MPLVSIVIPACNSASTIMEALESVKAQTFTDYEVIIVDDASRDDTIAVAERWLAAQPAGCQSRYRIIRQPANTGPAVARNRGVAAATGNWLAFLDADDAWLPRRLALQLEQAAHKPAVAMWCGRTEVLEERERRAEGRGQKSEVRSQRTEDGGQRAEVSDQRSKVKDQQTEDGGGEPTENGPLGLRQLELDEFIEHNPVATSTVLIRRAALESVGGFDPQFRGPEDYDLWMRVVAGYPVMEVQSPLCRYRYILGSLSTDDRTFLPQVLAVLKKGFRTGGVLHRKPGRRRAEAYHFLACSWMAVERGAAGRALVLLLRSLCRWPLPITGQFKKLPWGRTKLLWFLLKRICRRSPRDAKQ